jgi:mRNA interferase RelE/StbE
MRDSTYAIRYKKSVKKELEKLTPFYRAAIIKKILALAQDPRPHGSVKLEGAADYYRFRHADYRVIYQINDNQVIVVIIKVGHRQEVYRD